MSKALLWNALVTFEDRLTKVEDQLAGLQHNRKLLLRQMASQTENKLARSVMPGLTAKSAAHMSFNRLSKGCDKRLNVAAFQEVVRVHPGLERGLESLKELGTCVHTSGVSKQLVTRELLQVLINQEYANDDPVKPNVEAVLACLAHLAHDLAESLFVPTK